MRQVSLRETRYGWEKGGALPSSGVHDILLSEPPVLLESNIHSNLSGQYETFLLGRALVNISANWYSVLSDIELVQFTISLINATYSALLDDMQYSAAFFDIQMSNTNHLGYGIPPEVLLRVSSKRHDQASEKVLRKTQQFLSLYRVYSKGLVECSLKVVCLVEQNYQWEKKTCGKVRNLSYDSQPERWDLPKDTSIVRYAVLRFDMNQLCHLEKRIDGAIQMSFESTLVPDVTSGNEEQASMVIYYIMLEDPILAGTPVKRFSNLPNHSGTVLILIHNDGAWCLPLSVKSGISLHMIMLILQKSFYNASKDSRIMKAQELKTKTSAQALIPNVGYLIITFTSY
ncbi:hypothetical protein Tco_0428732 [Tanacetum coccineum]